MDYEALGFKAGLEIHQQLDTHKLFCTCPSMITDHVDYSFERELRPTTSEMGTVDQAALAEAKRNRRFVYCASDTAACMVDTDEEPPTSSKPNRRQHRPYCCHLVTCPTSKTVERQWENLMKRFDSEIEVLLDIPVEEVAVTASPAVAESVAAFRRGDVIVHPGGGGKYGEIEILAKGNPVFLPKDPQRRLVEWAT